MSKVQIEKCHSGDVKDLFGPKDNKIARAKVFIDNGLLDKLIFSLSKEDFDEIKNNLKIDQQVKKEIRKYFIYDIDENNSDDRKQRLGVL